MRKYLAVLLSGLSLTALPGLIPTAHAANHAHASNGVKEWTFLVYLNGHNNLDSYGSVNINQMEQVGSSQDINVVVQWASESAGTTKRVYVTQDNDTTKVTSPVVQDMGKVDMGDWRNVVDFIKWAQANYPAKHYFLDMWDHGSGWHALQLQRGGMAPGLPISPMDISWDDDSGNSITTQQLGQALSESAQVLGQKIDVYGSDACLMAMAEIATELSDSVQVFAGSEETEPAAGWPYDTFLKRWTANPQASPADVAKMLAEEYTQSYNGGENGTMDVTFSAFDLNHMGSFNAAISSLGSQLLKLDATERAKVVQAISGTQTYAYDDYADLGDFLTQIDRTRALDSSKAVDLVRQEISQFVIANHVTPRYSKSQGVAIWLPSSRYSLNSYATHYKDVRVVQVGLRGGKR